MYECDDVNRQNAEKIVEEKFREPLSKYKYGPRADVCFEALHSRDVGKHQDQVKVLIEKTASSLDDTALKMLFVSVQQNNIELCIQYAINDLTGEIANITTEDMTWRTMLWFGHSYLPNAAAIAHDLAVFLEGYFKSNVSGVSSTISYSKGELSLVIFTALLICMENTFWNISTDVNFVDLFKASFTLYVESGMMKKTEADIDISRYQGGHLVTKKFKRSFYTIIIKHYLSHLGDQVFEMEQKNEQKELKQKNEQEFEQQNEKKFTWLQNLMFKFHRGQRV